MYDTLLPDASYLCLATHLYKTAIFSVVDTGMQEVCTVFDLAAAVRVQRCRLKYPVSGFQTQFTSQEGSRKDFRRDGHGCSVFFSCGHTLLLPQYFPHSITEHRGRGGAGRTRPKP